MFVFGFYGIFYFFWFLQGHNHTGQKTMIIIITHSIEYSGEEEIMLMKIESNVREK